MARFGDFEGRWIHFVETVYGAWLSGDVRGFRTRKMREVVHGDYKNPPPKEAYENWRRQSETSLKQEPVELGAKWRPIVADAVRTKLENDGAAVLCLAQCAQHLHALAKVPDDAEPRWIMGLAKKHAAFELKAAGWQGKLWAKRGKEVRVKDRQHQLNCYRYIMEHAKQGAYVWDWRMNQNEQ